MNAEDDEEIIIAAGDDDYFNLDKVKSYGEVRPHKTHVTMLFGANSPSSSSLIEAENCIEGCEKLRNKLKGGPCENLLFTRSPLTPNSLRYAKDTQILHIVSSQLRLSYFKPLSVKGGWSGSQTAFLEFNSLSPFLYLFISHILCTLCIIENRWQKAIWKGQKVSK